ncbi:hypothetical protein BpHYR1_021368 [Brachionus plicatilis]|uniref:Uncharacterized protein n=1 Tax=Brachionus plicatilis TaxID=10195 RepID=A0A3M7Q7Y3_BRAPC|nr:hypothetical protein BpHYR1_021368 [Brachionus plicatilis]
MNAQNFDKLKLLIKLKNLVVSWFSKRKGHLEHLYLAANSPDLDTRNFYRKNAILKIKNGILKIFSLNFIPIYATLSLFYLVKISK